ncbi:5-bromo-4-chloroindolyl phosphate hydrolysis family protein [Anaerocolumna sp. MB42-C2]|uniref:5-bromo-4-chloroindolyl phosphate hydrolysis family protein n=1 Tax=Anaerocolumna sp. MB42-C2 TaxID=3070997 RepID=UPI0027E172D0|nr:5-bromo-4-chloroindolyl phosphate hydrolysis family protein [Anaerocolumna sp. MB42-C2]WMJ89765.1 5-bromo-4-chloroindolyl phosphate hydrolysis family protein [Anaerocolumna sp. MB42-C2]
MSRNNFSNLGDEIKDIVQDAVSTMNFQQLNKDIGNTVNGALDEVRGALGLNRDRQNQDINGGKMDWDITIGNQRRNRTDTNEWRSRRQNNQSDPAFTRQRTEQSPYRSEVRNSYRVQPKDKNRYCYPRVYVGKVSGILFTVFGSIGTAGAGIAAFVLAIIGQLTGNLNFFGTIALSLLPIFFISVFIMARGSMLRKRLRRFRRYLGVIENRSYYSVKELSANTLLSQKFVLKDLRKMISLGMFPEGRIDEQETCIMLNRESYAQYLELQKNIQIKNLEEQNNKSAARQVNEQTPSVNPSAKQGSTNAELRKTIENGRNCIYKIREANDAIPGEEISGKLDRLEDVISKIFKYVELHPEQLTEIEKFMDYYLPTTLKLVNAYREFDNQSVQGANITSAKSEIEATLDTINLAFEKLLDSLFEDAAMDVSTDISVLETMLAQEGLTKEDFKMK